MNVHIDAPSQKKRLENLSNIRIILHASINYNKQLESDFDRLVKTHGTDARHWGCHNANDESDLNTYIISRRKKESRGGTYFSETYLKMADIGKELSTCNSPQDDLNKLKEVEAEIVTIQTELNSTIQKQSSTSFQANADTTGSTKQPNAQPQLIKLNTSRSIMLCTTTTIVAALGYAAWTSWMGK